MPSTRSLALTRTRSPRRAPAPAARTAARKTAAKTAAKKAGGVTLAEAAGLTETQVRTILRFHLRNLSTSNAPTTDDTVLGDALSDLAVAGMSARALFKAISRRDIIRNGGTDKPWPAAWPASTVAKLAPKLAG